MTGTPTYADANGNQKCDSKDVFKNADGTYPSYFQEQTRSKNILRNGLAQNSQLSIIKGVYNQIEDDPHNDEYIKRRARERSSYDRYAHCEPDKYG